MKIGLAADSYKPYISGVTVYLGHLMRELRARGHEVTLFTFGAGGEPAEEGVLYSPGFRLPLGFRFGFRYSKEARRKMREMDLVHLHHPFISGQLALRTLGADTPLIFTAHTRYDFLSRDYLPGLSGKLAGWALRAYFLRFSRRMARIVCNSPASMQAMRNCGVERALEWVPNGVELAPFASTGRDPAWRQKLGGWAMIYLYIGRLAVEKNLPLLIDAFALLAREHPELGDSGLALVGSGPREKALRRQVDRLGLSARVKFLGAIPPEEAPLALHAADCFVMPSTKDTHPLTVIEALASGLPTVVVESEAYRGTIEDSFNGIICRADAAGLAQGMVRVAQESGLRVRLAEGGRLAARNFSLVATVDRLLQIYQQVLDEKQTGAQP